MHTHAPARYLAGLEKRRPYLVKIFKVIWTPEFEVSFSTTTFNVCLHPVSQQSNFGYYMGWLKRPFLLAHNIERLIASAYVKLPHC